VDGLEPRADVIVDFGIGSLRLRALPLESVRRDRFHAGTTWIMFPIICASAVSISLDGSVRVLVRTAQHLPFAVVPPVSGSVAANHRLQEVVKEFED
jgi:hypothetical protein